MYSNFLFHLLSVGLNEDLLTDSVGAPTAYDRVQNRQYTGQTEVAASNDQQHRPRQTFACSGTTYQGIGLYRGIDALDPEPASHLPHAANPKSISDGLAADWTSAEGTGERSDR